jgi:hypothetical protein
VLTPRTIVAPAAAPSSLTAVYTVGTTVAGVRRLHKTVVYFVNQAKGASVTFTVKKGGQFVQNAVTCRTDGRTEAADLGNVESGAAIQVQASDATSVHYWIDATEAT